VFQQYYDTHGVEALKSLCEEVFVGQNAVQAYYSSAPIATRQEFAALALEKRYKCRFTTTSISVKDIDEALLPLLLPIAASTSKQTDPVANRTVDMSFLEPLKIGGDKFLACKRILVRDCMRRVFSLFEEDRAPPQGGSRGEPDNAYSVALIGSPGVGKSILFFWPRYRRPKSSTSCTTVNPWANARLCLS
jgi:pantothenate kinase